MAGKDVLEFTDDNFEEQVLKSDQPVLVDFWAEWCGPCQMLAPTIDELATEFAGKVKVGKVDTESNRQITVKYQITAIPTMILFVDGEPVNRMTGMKPKKEIASELSKVAV